MDSYTKWMALKKAIKTMTEELHEVESDIYVAARDAGNLNPNGSKSFKDGDFKITIKHTETVKVNQDMAATATDLFKIKFDFDKTKYKELNGAQKAFVDECITITPGKPGFTVERL